MFRIIRNRVKRISFYLYIFLYEKFLIYSYMKNDLPTYVW